MVGPWGLGLQGPQEVQEGLLRARSLCTTQIPPLRIPQPLGRLYPLGSLGVRAYSGL